MVFGPLLSNGRQCVASVSNKMFLNIRIQWNAGTTCVTECVLKTAVACRGLRVGPSKGVTCSGCPQLPYKKSISVCTLYTETLEQAKNGKGDFRSGSVENGQNRVQIGFGGGVWSGSRPEGQVRLEWPCSSSAESLDPQALSFLAFKSVDLDAQVSPASISSQATKKCINIKNFNRNLPRRPPPSREPLTP